MLINDALLRIASGELSRLIVEMPPRHGKSELISHYAPPWFIGRFGWPVILASYEANFAEYWGGKARDVMRRVGSEVFGVSVKGRDQEKWWETSNGGTMITAGVAGPITGKGGRLLIIDDPVKNSEEAMSEVMRKRSADWYDSTFRSRLEPDGAIIAMATRWHTGDLLGYVQDKWRDEGWEVLSLPAIATGPDQLGRKEGEALWPERYDIAALEALKRSMSSYWWGSLYQQRPVSDEGSIFPRANWQRYRTLPTAVMQGGIYADTAGWEKDSDNDYGVIAVWQFDGVNFYVVDVKRGRWDFPDFKRRLKDTRAAYNFPIVIEETPWAKPLIQSLKEEVPGVIAYALEGRSKENRARAVQHYPEGLNVYIPDEADWVGDWVEEHAEFPFGTHDDQVDTSTMAMLHLTHSRTVDRQDRERNTAAYRATLGGVKA